MLQIIDINKDYYYANDIIWAFLCKLSTKISTKF